VQFPPVVPPRSSPKEVIFTLTFYNENTACLVNITVCVASSRPRLHVDLFSAEVDVKSYSYVCFYFVGIRYGACNLCLLANIHRYSFRLRV